MVYSRVLLLHWSVSEQQRGIFVHTCCSPGLRLLVRPVLLLLPVVVLLLLLLLLFLLLLSFFLSFFLSLSSFFLSFCSSSSSSFSSFVQVFLIVLVHLVLVLILLVLPLSLLPGVLSVQIMTFIFTFYVLITFESPWYALRG